MQAEFVLAAILPANLIQRFPVTRVRLGKTRQQKKNKAGYTANKWSLAGGKWQYTEGQGQSISRQGLYFGWAGVVMLRNHKYGQFCGIRNFAFRTDGHSDRQTDLPTKGHNLL